MSRAYLGQINSWLLVLLAFSLPLSTSVLSVTAILIFLLWLAEGNFRRKGQEIITNPVSLALLFYLGLYLLGLLWSDHLAAGFSMIEKQWKLALMPVFLTAVIFEHRHRYLWSFIAGTSVAALLTYLAWFGVLHYSDITTHHLTKGTFHVVYNPLLALAIYMLIHELLFGNSIKGLLRPPGLGLVLALVLDMFITEGRTGQAAFFVLMGLLVVQLCGKNFLKAVLVILVAGPLLFLITYRFTPTFHHRVNQAVEEISQFETNPNTSVGLRLLYWQNSLRLIRQHPWLGLGTGDFQPEYAKINQQNSPTIKPTDNPHNQYILLTCQFGLLGLLTLLTLFAVQIRAALCSTDGWQRLRLAFPLLFLTIMLAESYLMVYETGFLFSLFSGVLYKTAETDTGRKTSKKTHHPPVLVSLPGNEKENQQF